MSKRATVNVSASNLTKEAPASAVSPPSSKPLPPLKGKSRQTLLGLGGKKTSSTRIEAPAPAANEAELPVVYCKIEGARSLSNNAGGGFMYCSLKLEDVSEQTNYVLADAEPRWDEEFVLHVKQKMSCLELTVFAVDEEGVSTTYLGEANIPIHTLSSHKTLTEWFPLTSHDAGASSQGELRVVLYNSLQRSAMDALRELEEIYAQFLSILSSDVDLLTSLFDLIDPSDADRVGTSVVSIFSYLGKEQELFDGVIRQEVEGTASVSVLFRSNSMAIRLVSMFAKLTATGYLKTLLSSLLEETLSGDPSRFEVDATRLGGNAAQAKKNQKTLEDMVSKYFEAIFASIDRVPRILRRISAMFVEAVESKFPGSSEKAVGGFFFLRFVCPAIVAPATFGLLQKHPTGAAHRALVLVAKVLQNAANATLFKEAEMESFNAYLSSKQPELSAFFKALGSASAMEGESLNVLRPAAVADSCIVMAKLFRQHLPKLRVHRAEKPERAQVADELEKVLKDLATNELVHEKPYNATTLEPLLRKDGIVKLQRANVLGGASGLPQAADSLHQEEDEADNGVLNVSRTWQKPFHPGCARDLVAQALAIFLDECNKSSKLKACDWASVGKSSPEFRKLEAAVCELQKADLNLMMSQQQKQTFWLNVYHTLVLHILFLVGAPNSSYAKKLFYSNFRYRIGPYLLSLLDIENGVLRGNPILKGTSRQWSDSDRRRPLTMAAVDPGVLLALATLTGNAPIIVPYSVPTMDQQLRAVVGHLLSNVVEIDAIKREILLPKSFSRIDLSQNALLTFLYNYLGARKKLDVLYLQSKTYTVVVAKKAGKFPPPKALLAWYQSAKTSAQNEELPADLFGASSPRGRTSTASTLPSLPSSGSMSSLNSAPTTPLAGAAPVNTATIARRMDRQASYFDENIMRDSLSSLVQKVTGQLYDNQSLAQSIYAEVSKSVSVTIAFQTGKVIREVKMQLLEVDGITWTAASLEKFKQEVPMETPVLTRLQKLQVTSEQKQQQILKLLAAIQTAVVDIRFLLESVVVALQATPSMAVSLGRVSGSIKERLQVTLDRIVEKNAESSPFEELVTLESAIAPEIGSLCNLLRLFREQILSANLETQKGRASVFLLTAILNWVKKQLEASKAQPNVPFKLPQFDDTQLQAMPLARVKSVVEQVLEVIDSISAKFDHLVTNLLIEYGSRDMLIEVALLIRNCRNAMTQHGE